MTSRPAAAAASDGWGQRWEEWESPPDRARPMTLTVDRLVVVGARQHNLKNVSISLPRGKIVVFTGPSGSGKSSLAFDTIYAEGQRRYVESLSAYARQFLEQLAKPDVERIDGLSPAIAIEQRPLSKSPRSTVGTVTEIADYLRLLYARVGIPHCPNCGKRIEAQTVQQIVDRVLGMPEGTRLSIMAPIARARKGELKLELERLRREGFVRARIDGSVVDLGDEIELDRTKIHDLDVVVDRLVLKDGIKGRLTDSVELALKLGEGRLLVQPGEDEPFWMSERFACVDCGISLPPIEPRMFSFNGPHGACPTCDGLGARDVVDPERCIGDPRQTLREGVVLAWGRRASVALASELSAAVEALGVSPDSPWIKLPEAQRQAILYGLKSSAATTKSKPKLAGRKRESGKKQPYQGLVPRLEKRLASMGEVRVDVSDDEDPDAGEGGIADDELGRFLVTRTCDACKGKRLRPEALAVKLGGKDVAQVGAMPLRHVRSFVESLGAAAGGATPHHAATPIPSRPKPPPRSSAPASAPSPSRCSRPSPRASGSSSTSGSITSRSIAARRRSRRERGSASGSRRRSARRSWACSTSSTSPASACTRATTRASSRPRRAFAISATPSSSSSTIGRPSWRPTTSSTWAPAQACTAVRSSRRGHRARS
jgi:excinuclease ABC subunit A